MNEFTARDWKALDIEGRKAILTRFDFSDMSSNASDEFSPLDWGALPHTVRRTLVYFAK